MKNNNMLDFNIYQINNVIKCKWIKHSLWKEDVVELDFMTQTKYNLWDIFIYIWTWDSHVILRLILFWKLNCWWFTSPVFPLLSFMQTYRQICEMVPRVPPLTLLGSQTTEAPHSGPTSDHNKTQSICHNPSFTQDIQNQLQSTLISPGSPTMWLAHFHTSWCVWHLWSWHANLFSVENWSCSPGGKHKTGGK